MDPAVTVALCALGAQAPAFAALALRLLWQAAQEKRRQNTIRELATHMPPAGTLEVQDVRNDGTRFWLRIAVGAERSDDA